jgi:hypothetical protein
VRNTVEDIEEEPGEVKSLRGDRTASALNTPVGVTDRFSEQNLERAATSTGALGLPRVGGRGEYAEGTKQR